MYASKQSEQRASAKTFGKTPGTPNAIRRDSSLTGASSPDAHSLPPIAGAMNSSFKVSNSTARSPRRMPDSSRQRQSTSTTPRTMQSQTTDQETRRTSRQSTGLLSKINNWRRDSSVEGSSATLPRKRANSMKASKGSVSNLGNNETRSWASNWHGSGSLVEPTSARGSFSLNELSAGIASSRKKIPLWHIARDIVNREFKPKHFSTLPDAATFDLNPLINCFPALLTNEIGLTCFVRFCGENFALENMLFFEAVTCVLENPLPDSFHLIQKQYLDETAENNVNISGDLRRAIGEQINRMDMLGGLVGKELLLRLQDAQNEIFLVMERDLFHRFLSNPQSSEVWRLECRSAMDNLAKHQKDAPPPPPAHSLGSMAEMSNRGNRSLEFNEESSESESEQAPADGDALLRGRRAGVFSVNVRDLRATTIADMSGCMPLDSQEEKHADDHLTLAAVRASKAWEKCDLSNLVKKTTLPDVAAPQPLSERSMSARMAKRSSEALIESRLFGRQSASMALDVDLTAQDLESARSDRKRSNSFSRRSYCAREPSIRLSARVTLDDFDALTMQRINRTTEVEVASATAEAGAVNEERAGVRETSVLKCNDSLRMLVLRRSLREIQMAPLDDLKTILRENEHLTPAMNLVKAGVIPSMEGEDQMAPLDDPSETKTKSTRKSITASIERFERPISTDFNESHLLTVDHNEKRDSCSTAVISSESEEGEDTHRESLAKAIHRARLKSQAPKPEPSPEDDGYGAVLGRLQRALLDQEKRKSMNLSDN